MCACACLCMWMLVFLLQWRKLLTESYSVCVCLSVFIISHPAVCLCSSLCLSPLPGLKPSVQYGCPLCLCPPPGTQELCSVITYETMEATEGAAAFSLLSFLSVSPFYPSFLLLAFIRRLTRLLSTHHAENYIHWDVRGGALSFVVLDTLML